MSAIQEARYSVTTVAPRSFRYYAAGAVVHVALAAGLAAFGFGWSAAPLVVAAVLAVIAVRAAYTVTAGHRWYQLKKL